MKKYLFIFFILNCTIARPQQIPNFHFDSLCICAIDRVWQWVCSDAVNFISDTAQPFNPDALYQTGNFDLHMAMNTVGIDYECIDSAGEISGIKLFTRSNLFETNGSNFRGFVFNGEHFYTDHQGRIDWIRCGTAFTFRPDSISGIYKFEDSLSPVQEYGKIQILLKKFNPTTQRADTVGFAESQTELSSGLQWKRFSIPLQYLNSNIPDSVLVLIYSSTYSGKPTTLWLDKVQFVYSSVYVHEKPDKKAISVFPNPVVDKLYLSGTTPADNYQLFDLTGNELQSGKCNSFVPAVDLPGGVYYLKISGIHKDITTVKVVKL